jgi:Ca-activated chloride channel family protein
MALLNLHCALSNKYALVEGASRLKLLLEVTAAGAGPQASLPLNLTLVLDRSTSMMGPAIENVKAAANHLVDALADGDCVGVVGFSDTVQVLLASQPVRDRAAVKSAVERLRASGATNIHEALKAGHHEALRNFSADRVNRILFLSDGEATAGVLEDDKILALADAARADGVAISTMGVGEEYDEVLLGGLARRAGGNHYFIPDAEAIPRIFGDELAKVKNVVAKNVRIKIRPAGDTQVRMLNQRYACESIDGEFVVYLDEVERGRPQATILEVEVTGRSPGEFSPGTVTMQWDDMVEHRRGETSSAPLSLTFIADGARIREGIDRDVLRRWEELAAMHDLRTIIDQVKDQKIDSKTAVLELDKRTQALVKKKAIEAARAFAAVSKTIMEDGGVSASLSKRTMVACEEAEKGSVTSRTLLED